MMNFAKRLETRATRLLANASPTMYNLARVAWSIVDRISLKLAMIRNKAPILIYQQGRVASTSVYESVCAINLNVPVYHVHTLSPTRAEALIVKAKSRGGRIDRNLVLGRLLGRELVRQGHVFATDNPWRIICIFRDPISPIFQL